MTRTNFWKKIKSRRVVAHVHPLVKYKFRPIQPLHIFKSTDLKETDREKIKKLLEKCKLRFFRSGCIGLYLHFWPKYDGLFLSCINGIYAFKHKTKKLSGLHRRMEEILYPDVKYRQRKTMVGHSSKHFGHNIHTYIQVRCQSFLKFHKYDVPSCVAAYDSDELSQIPGASRVFEDLCHDLQKMGWKYVNSEVVIMNKSINVATQVDMICIDSDKNLHLLEFKTGFKSGLHRLYPGDMQLNLWEGIETQPRNTAHMRHCIQATLNMCMFNEMYKSMNTDRLQIKTATVVYLDKTKREKQLPNRPELRLSWMINEITKMGDAFVTKLYTHFKTSLMTS